jgi:hypothetical protein
MGSKFPSSVRQSPRTAATGKKDARCSLRKSADFVVIDN